LHFGILAVGKRKCPLCFVRVPWTLALTLSEEIRCPACHAELELSRFTRIFSGIGGFLGAFGAVHLTRGVVSGTNWATQIVLAIAVFGVTSAVCVLIAGDLVVRPQASSASFPQSKK